MEDVLLHYPTPSSAAPSYPYDTNSLVYVGEPANGQWSLPSLGVRLVLPSHHRHHPSSPPSSSNKQNVALLGNHRQQQHSHLLPSLLQQQQQQQQPSAYPLGLPYTTGQLQQVAQQLPTHPLSVLLLTALSWRHLVATHLWDETGTMHDAIREAIQDMCARLSEYASQQYDTTDYRDEFNHDIDTFLFHAVCSIVAGCELLHRQRLSAESQFEQAQHDWTGSISSLCDSAVTSPSSPSSASSPYYPPTSTAASYASSMKMSYAAAGPVSAAAAAAAPAPAPAESGALYQEAIKGQDVPLCIAPPSSWIHPQPDFIPITEAFLGLSSYQQQQQPQQQQPLQQQQQQPMPFYPQPMFQQTACMFPPPPIQQYQFQAPPPPLQLQQAPPAHQQHLTMFIASDHQPEFQQQLVEQQQYSSVKQTAQQRSRHNPIASALARKLSKQQQQAPKLPQQEEHFFEANEASDDGDSFYSANSSAPNSLESNSGSGSGSDDTEEDEDGEDDEDDENERPSKRSASSSRSSSSASARKKALADPNNKNLTPKQRVKAILRNWLANNAQTPYPTPTQKQSLMKTTNLTHVQLDNWFINARRRILPRILAEQSLHVPVTISARRQLNAK